jgi:hypothetical protein
MDDEHAQLQIGKYRIIDKGLSENDSLIYIGLDDGEGGEFEKADLEKVIDKFYKNNF